MSATCRAGNPQPVCSMPIIGVMISERREFASPSRKSANALKLFGEPVGPSAVRPPVNVNWGDCVS